MKNKSRSIVIEGLRALLATKAVWKGPMDAGFCRSDRWDKGAANMEKIGGKEKRLRKKRLVPSLPKVARQPFRLEI